MKRLAINSHTPFWFLTFAVLTGLTLPVLIQDGMFMDAMLYTSVAHNLGAGIGTFWFPQFSYYNIAGLPSFHEQPPLVFGIQSIFFRVLGDSMYVERFYTFLMLCLTAWFMHRLWQAVFKENLRNMSWLPLLFWITIPSAFWSYSNNMLENTMGLFTLLSVYLSYKSFHHAGSKTALWLASGIFIFLATFSKGFPGFFPVAVPFLYWLLMRDIRFAAAVKHTLVLAAVPLFIYLILAAMPDSRQSLSIYLFERAFHRMKDVPTVSYRFYTLTHIFMELLPQLILTGIILGIARLRNAQTELQKNSKAILFFLLVGLAASAPLMLTLVQKSFYYVPALPFFGIALAAASAPFLQTAAARLAPGSNAYRRWMAVGILLLISSLAITATQAGKAHRDQALLHDIYLIGKVVPKYSLVSVDPGMQFQWDYQCYLIRYFNISVEGGYKKEYCLIDEHVETKTPDGYEKVALETQRLHLFRRK